MKINFGMSETLVISGVYLYSSTVAFSVTLVVLGLLGKLLALGMEKAAEDKRQETTEKSIKSVVDPIVGAVSNAADLQSVGSKSGAFH